MRNVIKFDEEEEGKNSQNILFRWEWNVLVEMGLGLVFSWENWKKKYFELTQHNISGVFLIVKIVLIQAPNWKISYLRSQLVTANPSRGTTLIYTSWGLGPIIADNGTRLIYASSESDSVIESSGTTLIYSHYGAGPASCLVA